MEGPYSLGEVASFVKYACNGGGLPHGLSEEAGPTARWLEVRGLNSLDLIEHELSSINGYSKFDGKLKITGSYLHPAGEKAELIHSLIFAPAVRDLLIHHWLELNIETKFYCENAVFSPLWWPAVNQLSKASGMSVAMSCTIGPRTIMILSEDGILYVDDANNEQWGISNGSEMTISLCNSKARETDEKLTPVLLESRSSFGKATSAQTIKKLEELAAKTRVPASELSRQQGAGAGLTDSD